MSAPRVRALATELEHLRAESRKREASDRAVSVLDAWLRQGGWEDTDDLLEVLDPAQIHPAATLTILSVTHPVREWLEQRAGFLGRAEAVLPVQLGVERAELLLSLCR